MINKASGEFQVKLVPQTEERKLEGFGRLSIDKTFQGDITGISEGQMMSVMTTVPNSAGYVAIERVTCTLNGKQGSFVLQHHAIMDKGAPSQTIIVVPDSGTGELTGLTGQLNIIRKEGKHFYEMEYSLPE